MSPDQHRRLGYDVYVGHSQADHNFAQRITKVLSDSGLRVHLRLHGQAGDWTADVADALDRSRRYLLLASPTAAKSKVVDDELRYWINKREGLEDIVIGLVKGEFQEDALPLVLRALSLKHFPWVDLRSLRGPAEAFDSRAIDRLLDALLPRASAGASPPGPGGYGREEGFKPPDTGNTDEVPDKATVDQLHFSVTAPRPLSPGESREIFFWAHLESQLSALLRRLKERLGRTEYKRLATISQGPYRVRRGTVLTVALSVQDLIVHHATKSVLWNGKCGNAVFVVEVPKDTSIGNRAGTFSILVEGLELAALDFTLQIGNRKQSLRRTPTTIRKHKQAFASYASEDRAAVFARVQGMSKVAPEMNVFLDVLNLRSGQNWEQELTQEITKSNVFYLFWSESASRSEWVDKEWRFAYDKKGLGFIDPVPLQSPQVAPPPQELSAKHFNDIWIHYIESTGPTGLAASNAAGDVLGPGPG